MNGPVYASGTFPVGPLLTMYDPIYIGVDEFGSPVYTKIIYRNLLAAGEPGGGKSGLLNIFAAHAALSVKNRNVLFDGKQVELGMWDDLADEFVGPDLDHAIITLRRLQRVMDNRYTWLRAHRRRKIEPFDDVNVITSIFDEIALYSTVLGTEQQQREFVALFRDLVARGRAAAMPVIAATQRPSVDIIPKSVRDLFGYRAAFRCTSTGSSNIILGDGWSEAGFDATEIRPSASAPPTCLTPTSSPWPTTPPGPAAARPRSARPPSRRPFTSPEPRKGTVMHYTTQSTVRAKFITGLRELADYLDVHPGVPVPAYGADITVGADPTEDGGRGQVAHIAAQLGAIITDDTRQGGHLTATAMFGPIGYTVVSIPATVMADRHARDSYYGCITP